MPMISLAELRKATESPAEMAAASSPLSGRDKGIVQA